jgi:uncharacterized membrane protein YhdT
MILPPNKPILDYVAPGSRPGGRSGRGLFALAIASFCLGIVQLPALFVAAWIQWAYLTGDNPDPAPRWFVITIFLPSMAAIAVGIAPALFLRGWRKAFAVVGILVGIAWLTALAYHA